jgi:hypothetical protein
MKAIDRINTQEQEVYYKKVGKRYIQVNDPHWIEGLGKGFFLVWKKDGSTSIRHQIYPQLAEIRAGVELGKEVILNALQRAMKCHSRKKLTPEEAADWDAIVKKHPEAFSYLQYDSLNDMAENIIQEIRDLKKY